MLNFCLSVPQSGRSLPWISFPDLTSGISQNASCSGFSVDLLLLEAYRTTPGKPALLWEFQTDIWSFQYKTVLVPKLKRADSSASINR